VIHRLELSMFSFCAVTLPAKASTGRRLAFNYRVY